MIPKIIRFLLIFLISSSLLWIYDRYFLKAFHQNLDESVESLPTVKVDEIQVQAFNEKGILRFEIYGTRGEVSEKEAIAKISPVHMAIYDEKIAFQRKSTILASLGIHHKTKPQYFELIGNVELNTLPDLAQKGGHFYLRKLFTEKLLYYPDLEKFVSPGPFKIVDTLNSAIIMGKMLEYSARDERGEVQEGFEFRSGLDEDIIFQELNRGLNNEN